MSKKTPSAIWPLWNQIVAKANQIEDREARKTYLPTQIEGYLQETEDPNAKDNDGYSILHWAVMISGSPEVVELLLGLGADVNAKTDYGESILHVAVSTIDRKLAGLKQKLSTKY